MLFLYGFILKKRLSYLLQTFTTSCNGMHTSITKSICVSALEVYILYNARNRHALSHTQYILQMWGLDKPTSTLPSLTPAANVSHLPPSPNTFRTFSLLYWDSSTCHIQTWVGLSHPWSPSSFISDPYLPHLNIETHRLSPSKVSRIAMACHCTGLCFWVLAMTPFQPHTHQSQIL